MRRAAFIVLSLVLVCLARSADAQPHEGAIPPGYALRKAIGLAPSDGVSGRIELLEDARITPSIRPRMGDGGFDYACADPDGPALKALCDSINRDSLRDAVVRLVSSDGRVLSSRRLDRPLADIGFTRLYGTARRTYLVTTDYSIGMGSYAGPGSILAEVRGGRMRWLRAIDARTGRAAEIRLVSTLKTEWQEVPGPDGRGREFLQMMCRPDLDHEPKDPNAPASFLLTFERYAYERGAWRVHRRIEPGFWETEDGFPPRRRFP